LHDRVKHENLKKCICPCNSWWQSYVKLLLWIVNRFEKHILRIWNIVSLIQWQLTRLPYCQISKSPPLAFTQARSRALHQLRYQMHSVEGRASTSWTRDWYTPCWTKQ